MKLNDNTRLILIATLVIGALVLVSAVTGCAGPSAKILVAKLPAECQPPEAIFNAPIVECMGVEGQTCCAYQNTIKMEGELYIGKYLLCANACDNDWTLVGGSLSRVGTLL